MFRLAITFFLFIVTVAAHAQQTQPKTATEYYEIARMAYAKQEYASFVENLHKVVEAGTHHPFVYYNLAAGYSLLKKPEQALSWLNKIADLGIVYDLSDDPDFADLIKAPAYQEVQKRFDRNLNATKNSAVALTIPQQKFLPEGVTYDSAGDSFLVSSILLRKIIRIDRSGKVTDFTSSKDSIFPVLGMSIDPERKILWASSSMMWQLQNSDKPPDSELLKFDLQTGKLLKRYPITTPKTGHQLGDVIVNSGGDAFTTDSFSPAIYRVASTSDEIELFLGGEVFRSPQGLAFSPDQKTLFVADYVRGLFAIDVNTKEYKKLDPPASTTIAGIDGLYFHKGSLIATQNGFEPNRVLRIVLNQQQNRIERVDVLESNHELFDEITLGTVTGDHLYYVANGQLNKYLNNPKRELKSPVILKLPLQ